jgi:hypothetical protein
MSYVRPYLIRLLSIAALMFTIFVFIPGAAFGAGSLPTAIAVSAPTSVSLGDQVTLEARLESNSRPVAQAHVYFSIPTSFLGASADVMIAEVVTDSDGLAKANFEARSTGAVTVKAQFRGDASYAPSESGASMQVTGSQQLYAEKASLSLQGWNRAPLASGGWPHWALSGWPIAAVLIVVWSMYGVAVYFMSRISAAADDLVGVANATEVQQ